MNDLVVLKGNDVFTDSLVIAEGTGIEHRKIKAAIKKHKNSIETFVDVTLKILHITIEFSPIKYKIVMWFGEAYYLH